MKKLLTTFLLSSFCFLLWSQRITTAPGLALIRAQSGGTTNSGITYILDEQFETGSASAPTGWTTVGGTPIWNSTPAILDSYSYKETVSYTLVYYAFSAQSTLSFRCRMIVSAPNGSISIDPILFITDANGASVAGLRIYQPAGAVLVALYANTTNTAASSYSITTTKTNYYQMDFTAGGAVTAYVWQVGTTKPVSDSSSGAYLTSTATNLNAGRFYIYAGAVADVIVDDVKISASVIP